MKESQSAVALVRVRVLHRDVVLCVRQVKPLFVCLALVLWPGRCGGHTRKVSSLPALGVDHPQPPHGPTSRAPVQKESRTVSLISFAFLGVLKQ